MIDTIKLSYPLNPILRVLLEQKAEVLQKISPDGEILWEKSVVSGDCMPSHYSGLRIAMRKASDARKDGFTGNIKSIAFFEFSLQKYQSKSAYNNKNTDLKTDIKALAGWVKALSSALGYEFRLCEFDLYRVDLSENLILEAGSPRDYIRSLELKMSKYHDAEFKIRRAENGIKYVSQWVGKKIYWKFKEFQDVERKKHRALYSDKYMEGEEKINTRNNLIPLSPNEIKEMMRMIRFECEFKRQFLKRYNLIKIFDLEKMEKRFMDEKKKFISVKVLSHGDVRLTPMEEKVINLVKKFGFNGAKQELLKTRTERTWYNIKRGLATKGIYLEALINSDERLSDDEKESLPEEFKLRLAS